MEVRFSHLDDPLGYLSDVLRKQCVFLNMLTEHPKPSIAALYQQNVSEIDKMLADVISGWHSLRQNTMGAAVSDDFRSSDELALAIEKSHQTAQRCLRLFDAISLRYDLPRTEPILFAKIGTVLVR